MTVRMSKPRLAKVDRQRLWNSWCRWRRDGEEQYNERWCRWLLDEPAHKQNAGRVQPTSEDEP